MTTRNKLAKEIILEIWSKWPGDDIPDDATSVKVNVDTLSDGAVLVHFNAEGSDFSNTMGCYATEAAPGGWDTEKELYAEFSTEELEAIQGMEILEILKNA